MHRSFLQRLGGCLAAAWLGVLLCVAFLAAPAAFAVLSREMAGAVVGRLFEQEAALSLLIPVLILMLLRRLSESESGSGLSGLATDGRVWASLGALVCTVVGYYALHPMMDAARTGQGTLSFGALHGISVGFFGLKILIVAFLAWRLAR